MAGTTPATSSSVDAAGFVSIVGRAKRFAKIGGEMVSMTAAESLVASLWPEARHAVVSVPDARKGEALLLVTTRKDAEHARAAGVRAARRAGDDGAAVDPSGVIGAAARDGEGGLSGGGAAGRSRRSGTVAGNRARLSVRPACVFGRMSYAQVERIARIKRPIVIQ